MKYHTILLMVVISSLLISTCSAVDQPDIFPDSYGIDKPNFTQVQVTGTPAYGEVVQPTIYHVQETVIPWELWAFLTALGIGILLVGLVGPQGPELILACLSSAFLVLSWILSPFIGWFSTESAVLAEGVLVVQPVAILLAPTWLPWVMLVIWVISLGFLILAMLNFPIKASKAKPGRLQ